MDFMGSYVLFASQGHHDIAFNLQTFEFVLSIFEFFQGQLVGLRRLPEKHLRVTNTIITDFKMVLYQT